MILKSSGIKKTPLNRFDLLGSNENALSKAFAYLISSDKDCYFEFLKHLKIKIYNSESNFQATNIIIQKKRNCMSSN